MQAVSDQSISLEAWFAVILAGIRLNDGHGPIELSSQVKMDFMIFEIQCQLVVIPFVFHGNYCAHNNSGALGL